MRHPRSDAPLTARHALFQDPGDALRPEEPAIESPEGVEHRKDVVDVEPCAPGALLVRFIRFFLLQSHDVDPADLAALLANTSVRTE